MTPWEDVTDKFIFRPLALPVVEIGLKFKTTPNQITFASLCLGVASSACFLWLEPNYAIGFLLLSVVLDCADGQLARRLKQGSLQGEIYDHVADDLKSWLLAFSISFGTANLLGQGVGIASGLIALVAGTLLGWHSYYYLERANGLGHGKQPGIDELRNSQSGGLPKLIASYYFYRQKLMETSVKAFLPLRKNKQLTGGTESYRLNQKGALTFWSFVGPSSLVVYASVLTLFFDFRYLPLIALASLPPLLIVGILLQRRADKKAQS